MGESKATSGVVSVVMKTTDCYNCTGKRKIMRGFCQPGCDLCSKYGTGFGELDDNYRHQPVTITNSNGVATVYTPPTYSCVVCEDKKTFENYVHWQLASEPGCPGYDVRFPVRLCTLPCYKCAVKEYDAEFKKITDSLELEKATILADSPE